MTTPSPLRHDWTREEVEKWYAKPFFDLLNAAHQVHRAHFDPNAVQASTLLSIKTGACPENCAYCPQSGHYDTGVDKHGLLDVDTIVTAAQKAKDAGATRFCMGAGWRNPPKKSTPKLVEILKAVKGLGMETCMTLGMLDDEQVKTLDEAGLDYYNHNLDSSEEYYEKIISTRKYQDRLDTLDRVRESDIKVCCGGIVGMGETVDDRLGLLITLANLPSHPDSVPMNKLIPIPGTPLEDEKKIDPFEFIRIIALARIMMPNSFVRLSAGRTEMSDEMQAMCFFAGANSIHYGEKLLVTPTPDTEEDESLFARLGIQKMAQPQCREAAAELA